MAEHDQGAEGRGGGGPRAPAPEGATPARRRPVRINGAAV